jgi:hypothetical protein
VENLSAIVWKIYLIYESFWDELSRATEVERRMIGVAMTDNQ